MGLTGAAVGLNSSIQDMLLARLQERQYQDKLRQQDLDNQMREKQFQSNEELKRAQLDATTEARRGAEEDRKAGLAEKLANTIPADTPMAFTDPAVGKMTTAGYGSLIPDKGLNPQAPASLAAPDAPTGDLPGTIANAPFPNGRIVTKRPSFNQQKDAENRAQQETAAQHQADELTRQQARDDETNRHNRAMENKPVSEQGWTIQQGTVNGKPGWVRINSHTGQIVPVSAGEITPKPSAQEAQETRTKAEAVDTLSQLDKAIDDASPMLGPGAGRISNVEQMVGSADPRIQALGVKMKAAKMRVDHAITGSVRAGASPVLLQQWDNILANKVDPAGLKAAVQAMREIIGGGNAPAAGGSKIKSITEIR